MSHKIFDSDLVAIHKLELSKVLMNEFHYN